jgi:carbon-monoxide dehydrogenase medium subunit
LASFVTSRRRPNCCSGCRWYQNCSCSGFLYRIFSTVLEESDIITQIRIPIPPAGTKSTYQKFVQPASRFAIVGCAAVKEPSGTTRVAFAGVSDYAFRDEAVESASSSGASVEEAASKPLKG